MAVTEEGACACTFPKLEGLMTEEHRVFIGKHVEYHNIVGVNENGFVRDHKLSVPCLFIPYNTNIGVPDISLFFQRAKYLPSLGLYALNLRRKNPSSSNCLFPRT